jgi:hypothetical protein
MAPSSDRRRVRAASVGAVVGVLVLPMVDVVIGKLIRVTTGFATQGWDRVRIGAVVLVGPGWGIVSWLDPVFRRGPGRVAGGYIEWLEWVPVFILNACIFAVSGVAVDGRTNNARYLRVAVAVFWCAWLVVSVMAGLREQFPWQP